MAIALPLEVKIPVLIILCVIATVGVTLLREEWFVSRHTNATAKANQNHFILASQPEVDLEDA
jgi:hypothetical protein